MGEWCICVSCVFEIFQVQLFSLIECLSGFFLFFFCFFLFFLVVSVPTIDMCPPPPNLYVNPLVYVKFVDADHVAVVLWHAR